MYVYVKAAHVYAVERLGLSSYRKHFTTGSGKSAKLFDGGRTNVRHGWQDQNPEFLAGDVKPATVDCARLEIVAVENVIIPSFAGELELKRCVEILRLIHKVV